MLVSLDEPVRYIDRQSTAYDLGPANHDTGTRIIDYELFVAQYSMVETYAVHPIYLV
jgi:hypothetical protein